MKKSDKEFLAKLWADEFINNDLCGLCGNSGVIDTRHTAVSAAGVNSGGRFFCICPNGRAMKDHYETVESMEQVRGRS